MMAVVGAEVEGHIFDQLPKPGDSHTMMEVEGPVVRTFVFLRIEMCVNYLFYLPFRSLISCQNLLPDHLSSKRFPISSNLCRLGTKIIN